MESRGSQYPITRFVHYAYRIIRILLAAAFIWSGCSKLFAIQSFIVIIDAYGIIPEPILFPTALLLAFTELVAGIGLLIDLKGSLGVISALLFIFMGVLGYGIFLGLDVDCGCFGPDDIEGQAFHGLRSALYRDILMVLGIIFLYFWRYHQSLPLRRLPVVSIYNLLRR